MASQNGNLEVVRLLVQKGININAGNKVQNIHKVASTRMNSGVYIKCFYPGYDGLFYSKQNLQNCRAF